MKRRVERVERTGKHTNRVSLWFKCVMNADKEAV